VLGKDDLKKGGELCRLVSRRNIQETISKPDLLVKGYFSFLLLDCINIKDETLTVMLVIVTTQVSGESHRRWNQLELANKIDVFK